MRLRRLEMTRGQGDAQERIVLSSTHIIAFWTGVLWSTTL